METFFTDETASSINAAFEKLRLEEKFDYEDEGAKTLFAMRDNLLAAFNEARSTYNDLRPIRFALQSELASSFCIIGTEDAVNSALLANSILTSHVIKPMPKSEFLFLLLGVCLFCFACVFFLNGFISLLTGFFLSALALIGFSESFIASGIWLNPIIPCSACFVLCITSLVCNMWASSKQKNMLFNALSPFVNNRMIQKLCAKKDAWKLIEGGNSKKEKPVFTAVIAVRNSAQSGGKDLKKLSDAELAVESAVNLRQFRKEAVDKLTAQGAVVISVSSDTVIAAIGSPLEKALRKKSKEKNGEAEKGLLKKTEDLQNNIKRAVRIVQTLCKQDAQRWHIAIDAGPCSFYHSNESGYTAEGRAITRSRVLLSFAVRYSYPAIISVPAGSGLPFGFRVKPASSADHTIDDKTRDTFYELVV